MQIEHSQIVAIDADALRRSAPMRRPAEQSKLAASLSHTL
jgi:hypothetical protein